MTAVRLDSLPDVMTVQEAAEALRVGRTCAYDAIRRGDLRSVRIGKFVRITKAALLEFLAADSPHETQ